MVPGSFVTTIFDTRRLGTVRVCMYVVYEKKRKMEGEGDEVSIF